MLGTLLQEEKSRWSEQIGTVVHAYNCTKHESTGFSQFELLFGRPPHLPIDIQHGLSPSREHSKDYAAYSQELRRSLDATFKIVSKHLQSLQQKQKGAMMTRSEVFHLRSVI